MPEVSSTRALIATADLIKSGLTPHAAIKAAMIGPLCDDKNIVKSLMEIVKIYVAND